MLSPRPSVGCAIADGGPLSPVSRLRIPVAGPLIPVSRLLSPVLPPPPLHLQECFHELGYKEGDLPESERASKEVLSLPVFPELTEEEVNWVSEAVIEFMERVRL